MRSGRKLALLMLLLLYPALVYLSFGVPRAFKSGSGTQKIIHTNLAPSVLKDRAAPAEDSAAGGEVEPMELPGVVADPPVEDEIAKEEGGPPELSSEYVDYRVHAFYYGWYRNVETDGQWSHWDHQRLPHWNAHVAAQYPTGKHNPPDDIGAAFYPQLGPYSSRDTNVIQAHMKQLYSAGVGVIALSWYPLKMSDDNGLPNDDFLKMMLDAAAAYGLKVCIHSEPYRGRTAATMVKDLQYVADEFGSHSALYRVDGKIVVYVYDAYHVAMNEWATILAPAGSQTIRGTHYDAFMIALALERDDVRYLVDGHFDGIYTYFASNTFTYASKWSQWSDIAQFAKDNGKVFVPSVGPGYNDLKVRPWNKESLKPRDRGSYYNSSFSAAVHCPFADAAKFFVSITSFNEWGEGTQIEQAIPKGDYEDYEPDPPDYYLRLTQHWVAQMPPEL